MERISRDSLVPAPSATERLRCEIVQNEENPDDTLVGTGAPAEKQRIVPQEYVVDKIVDHSVYNDITLFRVLWYGFLSKKDT